MYTCKYKNECINYNSANPSGQHQQKCKYKCKRKYKHMYNSAYSPGQHQQKYKYSVSVRVSIGIRAPTPQQSVAR